jgi:hypothetical protein
MGESILAGRYGGDSGSKTYNVTTSLFYPNGGAVINHYVNCFDGKQWFNYVTNNKGMVNHTLNRMGNATFYYADIVSPTGGYKANSTVINNITFDRDQSIYYILQNPATIVAWLRNNTGENINGWWVNFYDGSWHNLTTNNNGKASITTNNIGNIVVYSPDKNNYTGGGYNNVTVSWNQTYTTCINFIGPWGWKWNIYTSNGTFTAPFSTNYYVMCYGGGGSGNIYINRYFIAYFGGGGGYMNNNGGNPTYLTAGTSVPITVGSGGIYNSSVNTDNSGGSSSFGTYLSALGGGGTVNVSVENNATYTYPNGSTEIHRYRFWLYGSNGGSGGGIYLNVNNNGGNFSYPLKCGTGGQFGSGGYWHYYNNEYLERRNSSMGINTINYTNEYLTGYGSAITGKGGGGYGGNANGYGGGGYGSANYGAGGNPNSNTTTTQGSSGIVTIRWYG